MIAIPEPKKENTYNGTGVNPCLICGRELNGNDDLPMFRVWQGAYIVTDAYVQENDDGGSDTGYYPVGKTCYRNHRKVLKPYLNGG